MSFISVLLMLGIFNAVFWGIMICVMIGLFINIVEGGLIAGM